MNEPLLVLDLTNQSESLYIGMAVMELCIASSYIHYMKSIHNYNIIYNTAIRVHSIKRPGEVLIYNMLVLSTCIMLYKEKRELLYMYNFYVHTKL